MKKVFRQIDLWNDHKPSQALDPFIFDYFHEEDDCSFDYDEIIVAPNLIGNYRIDIDGVIADEISPEFKGGVIFLKNGEPKRLYLCHVNSVVTSQIGHKFNADYILDALESNELIGETGKTLGQLLKDAGVKRRVDYSVTSGYVASKYVEKTEAAFESADNMEVLKALTFLNAEADWETINFYPEILSSLKVVGDDFEIEIEHKGLIAGVKKNQGKLQPQLQGRKAYAIALQTADEKQYKEMVEFTKGFVERVKNQQREEIRESIYLDEALLDK